MFVLMIMVTIMTKTLVTFLIVKNPIIIIQLNNIDSVQEEEKEENNRRPGFDWLIES